MNLIPETGLIPNWSLLAYPGSHPFLEAQSKVPGDTLPAKWQTADDSSCILCPSQDVEQPEPSQPEHPFGPPVMTIKALPLAMMQAGRSSNA